MHASPKEKHLLTCRSAPRIHLAISGCLAHFQMELRQEWWYCKSTAPLIERTCIEPQAVCWKQAERKERLFFRTF
jgi:hypothetical protein